MAININSNFSVGAALPIDERLVLSKSQMLSINENIMPKVYFAICSDDGKLYLFNKDNESIPDIGKFRAFTESSSTQIDTMPEASVDNVGKIIQYTGDSTEDYTHGYFYECLYNEDTTTYEWVNINTQASSINATIPDNITSNVSVGGIASGTTFASGTAISDIINQLLVKYFSPSTSLSLTPSTTIYKKGTSVDSLTLKAAVTKQTNDITSVTFYQNGSTELLKITENVASGGTFSHTLTSSITTDTSFKVVVTDGKTSAESSKSLSFVNPYYYGVSDTNTITSVTGLTELVESKGTKTVSYTADNQYLVFMFDATYSDLTSIKDANKFENISSFTKSTVTIDDVNYKVYISNTPVTCTNFSYTLS